MTKTVKPAEKKLNKHIAIFIETVCCYFFSIAAFILSKSLIGISFPLSRMLLYPAIIFLCLYLLTRKWWIIPSVVGVSILGSAIIAVGKRSLYNSAVTKITLFFKWWFYDTALPDGWNEDKALHLLYLLTYIAICCILYAIIIPFRKNWTALIFSLVIFALGCGFCNASETLAITVLLLVGFFPLLSDRIFLKRMVGRNSAQKIKSALSAVLIIALACTFIICTFPSDTSKYHYRPCSDAVADLQSATGIYSDKDKYRPNITLEAIGLQPDSKRIGGTINKIEKIQTVCSLYDDQSRVCKVTTFDTFTGSNWKHTSDGFYRINGPFKDAQTECLAFNPEVTKDEIFKKYFKKSRIGVAIPTSNFSLYTVSGMYSFKENSKSNNTLLFNSAGDVFSPWAQHNGYSYSFSTYTVKDWNGLMFVDAVKELDTMFKKYAVKCPDDIKETYTQLPKFWSSYISKRTGSIKASGTMETVFNAYLFMHSLGIKCTDEPNNENPSNYSPIDQMIYNKSGNCVQYASALCMILRDCGVPSRLAAGFRSVQSNDSGKYHLLTKTATAWVEVYISGFGWLGLDIIPSDHAYNINNVPKKQQTEQDNTDKGEEKIVDKEKDKEKNNFLASDLAKALLVIIAAALLVAIIRIFLSYFVKSNKFARYLYNTPEGLYIFYYRDMLSAAKYLDIVCTEEQTMKEIEAKVFGGMNVYGIEDCFTIAEQICYNGYIPTETEIYKLKKVSEAVDESLSSKKNIIAYIIKRKLFRPLTVVPKFTRFAKKKRKH